MDSFLKEYNGKVIGDACMVNSKDAKRFSRKFKNYLKRMFPECEIVNYRLGHYEVGGFLRNGDNYIYFSYNIPRYGRPININCGDGFSRTLPMEEVLYRAVRNDHDYSFGHNQYTSLANIQHDVKSLFAQVERNGGPLCSIK